MSDVRALDYPHAAPPAPAEMLAVAPGIHWVRMPIPLALDHINLWLIEDEDADGAPTWTIVDSGFGHEETKRLWRRLFDGPASGRRPHRLICTHYHPDHFGLAGWLAREYGVTTEMTEGEWIAGTLLQRLDDAAFTGPQDAFFARNGLSTDLRETLRAEGNEFAARVDPPPERFTRIRDGEHLSIGGRSWHVVTVEGHAPEHACLHCPDLSLMICGDQLLPKITPNISVWWFKDGTRPLSDFLRSLDRLEALLPADTLILPSHKLPYRGAPRRIDQLRAHHAERLEALRAGLRALGPAPAADLIETLFERKLDAQHMIFALGETVAHLEHLVEAGTAEASLDADGVRRYALT
ncbi:MBL fold metallo-hydrolase [Marivibrio halodurans]|nr:MBL fold metallo-hydrolase [Marivibrio halodurans]